MSTGTAAGPGAGRRPDRIFPGYVFDLDGTVYLGDALLPGAGEAIARLREAGARVVFVTNKPLEPGTAYAEKLDHLGVTATRADVVTSVDSLVGYLRRDHPSARLLCVTEASTRGELEAAGFEVTSDSARTDVVVVSFDRTFDYAKLNAAYRAVKHHGAAIVATNPDPYCPTPDGGLPDCAAMLAAIEACTGARAEAIVGKPSVHMARALEDRLGLTGHDVAVVGDRLLTDVAMAHSLGMTGVLVLTGATTLKDLEGVDVTPDFVIDGLGQLVPPTPSSDRR